MQPTVDINLFVHNGASTVAAAIDSVLAQSWTNWRMTLIDDGSTDNTPEILAAYAARSSRITLKRNRCNTGAVGAFQRGLWFGDADFVMPKSSDDLIAPDYLAELMTVMLAHPECAMVHAGGLSFQGAGVVQFQYPDHHRLHAVGDDPLVRASHVMARYTSSPSFWGVYRRDAVDRLAPIANRAGWDHVLLAELAMYGEIRHVPELLYWRRGTGRPLLELARAATQESIRGIALDQPTSDPLWRMPCMTTAYAHVENFSVARVDVEQRRLLISAAVEIFGHRWGGMMRRELSAVLRYISDVVENATSAGAELHALAQLHLMRLLTAVTVILLDADLSAERSSIAALISGGKPCPV